MATAAQIEANRRNAKRSTGPKSDDGKQRVRGNALKHGLAALTIVPFSSQGDPTQLEERTHEWESDLQPQNALERNLVRQGARLSLAIERGEWIEAQMIGAWRCAQIRELGRRLLYIAGPEEVKVSRMPHWADDPGLLVSQLEQSAEGCRWLLERWAEFRNLLDHKSNWEVTELLRFIRLQGKTVVESVYDPALNSIFLAWDVLVPKFAKQEWHDFQQVKPQTDPAFNHRLVWREIADRPSNPAAAWAVLYGVVEQHVGRLQELLVRNEAGEAAEDADWAACAGLDSSPALERLRRCQSARHRELMRTLDALRKMRKEGFGRGSPECGMRNAECGIGNEEEEKADDECRMADDGCQMANDEGQSSGPLTEDSSDPVVGHDSNRVIDDSTNDKIGILSHEGAHAAGQPGQGDGAGQCLPDGVTTPQKAPNKANLESKQGPESQGLESEPAGAEGQEQSQFPQAETTRKPTSRDVRPARQSGRQPVASQVEGSKLPRPVGFPPLGRSDDLDSPGDGPMNSSDS